jgi:hypothetical protein
VAFAHVAQAWQYTQERSVVGLRESCLEGSAIDIDYAVGRQGRQWLKA